MGDLTLTKWEVIWSRVKKVAKKLQDYYEDHFCPATKYANENLKFSFNVNALNNDEFKLVDDSFRKVFITEIAKEVHKDIDTFKKAYN